MSQQIAVEISSSSANRASVEVVEEGQTRIVEVTRTAAAPVVEVLLPGPQGPPGAPAESLAVIDGGTFN